MKTLRRCKNNWVPENVVLIDVDSDGFNNVKIDIPKNLAKNLRGSNGLKNGKNVLSRTYIYIDDDDESPGNQHAGTNTNFAHENPSPVKLTKSKRMYAGKGLNNCYDFSMQADGDSSYKDSLDCEFMVDSSGMLQEQWKIASLKRKTNVQSFSMHFGDIADIGSRNLNLQVDRTSSHQNPCSVETVDYSHGFGHEDNKSEETPSSSTSSKVENEGNFTLNTSNTDDAPVENSIVNEREKLKETEEYKQALEEEWSARQRALKVQAEEAQQLRRLLKRKKAESTRLLDMERRQKQRLEEIRETQKKDEENMILKEMYRTEVHRELNKLKTTCHDMASLLRCLGVLTNNDSSVSSLQVRAAYKRALLSFHPDRASGSDVREQVEAEEKFKLISRMKDKIL